MYTRPQISFFGTLCCFISEEEEVVDQIVLSLSVNNLKVFSGNNFKMLTS